MNLSILFIHTIPIGWQYCPELRKHTLGIPDKRHHKRLSRMSDGEVMTIFNRECVAIYGQ